jgi:hypothetical protein
MDFSCLFVSNKRVNQRRSQGRGDSDIHGFQGVFQASRGHDFLFEKALNYVWK